MPRSVLFIFEGQQTEVEIYDQLKKDFSKFDSAHVYATFNTNIYKLYDDLKKYGFDQDLVSLITFPSYDELPDDFSRDFFTEIYLFFDYDGHADIANDEKLTEMLTHFNEETDEGKLYISYPMAEALKHIENGICFKNTVTAAKEKIGYKQLVSQVGDGDYMHITRYDLNIWHKLIEIHGMKLNFIVNEEYIFPNRYISQKELFTSQLGKHIMPSKSIAVLSAFPILIIDYYGTDEIQKRIALTKD